MNECSLGGLWATQGNSSLLPGLFCDGNCLDCAPGVHWGQPGAHWPLLTESELAAVSAEKHTSAVSGEAGGSGREQGSC